MRRSLALLLAAAALVAAGCGSDSSSSTSTGSSVPASTGSSGGGGGAAATTVDMKNIQFEPKDITVDVGQEITWENLDTVDHDVVADSGADFKSDQFGKGGTFSFTPDKAGKIEYECTLHPGMTGTITVR